MNSTNVPSRYWAQCHYCSSDLDIRRKGVFQRVTGWTELRAGGGANAIALPQRVPDWSCGACINLLRKGISPAQGRLPL